MKKYNWIFRCYGQSTASKIAYYQKMGIAQGICKMLLNVLDNKNLKLSDFKETFEVNGHQLETKCIAAVIPSPEKYSGYLDSEYPWFEYNGKHGVIDMLHYNSELSFHFMCFDYDTKKFENGGWHTIRECLNLEDTITLFEYVEDRQKDLIILPKEEYDKYNSAGALGVGMNEEIQ